MNNFPFCITLSNSRNDHFFSTILCVLRLSWLLQSFHLPQKNEERNAKTKFNFFNNRTKKNSKKKLMTCQIEKKIS